MVEYRIPFGKLVINDTARKYLSRAINSNWVTEGRNVAEFEQRFADKFGWKYAVACSSGTTSGEVLWAAIRELHNAKHPEPVETPRVVTPACAFVSTANCLITSGLMPQFTEVGFDTLNLDAGQINWSGTPNLAGVQFVSTCGLMAPVETVSREARKRGVPIIGDLCEAHGGEYKGKSSKYFDAAIWSFYVAHIIVGGEGGIICTNDEDIQKLCQSIKSHGRPPGQIYFQFDRPGGNAKANDLCFAIALGSLEDFDKTFQRRREIRQRMLDGLKDLGDQLILYPDKPGELVSPHAFPMVLAGDNADATEFYKYLEAHSIQTKWLFKSIATQHAGFAFMGHKEGDFPVAERLGRAGVHIGCSEHWGDTEVNYVIETAKNYFAKGAK